MQISLFSLLGIAIVYGVIVASKKGLLDFVPVP